MKFQAVNTTHLIFLAVGVGAFFYVKNKTFETVAEVAEKINPVNKENVINTTFDKATKAVTGSNKSLGEMLADWINPHDDINAHLKK